MIHKSEENIFGLEFLVFYLHEKGDKMCEIVKIAVSVGFVRSFDLLGIVNFA